MVEVYEFNTSNLYRFDMRQQYDASLYPQRTAYESYFKDDGFGNLIFVWDNLSRSIQFIETLKEY